MVENTCGRLLWTLDPTGPMDDRHLAFLGALIVENRLEELLNGVPAEIQSVGEGEPQHWPATQSVEGHVRGRLDVL